MNPHPNHGETRAMLSWSAINTFHKIMPNAFDGQLGHRLGLTHNCNLIEGIPKVDGFYSLYLPEEREVCSRLFSGTNSVRSGLADFLGVSQITAEGSDFDWVVRPSCLPLATVGQRPEFLNREETLNALLEPGFNPKNVVYLPPAARAFISATNRTEAKILASKFSAHHATMTVEANQPSMLIVAQSFYHPWNAYVDGKAAQLWPAGTSRP